MEPRTTGAVVAIEAAAQQAQELADEQRKKFYHKPGVRLDSEFIGVSFAGQLSDFKTRRDGTVLVQFVVPHRFMQDCLDLGAAYGLMLQVDVERWRNRNVGNHNEE